MNSDMAQHARQLFDRSAPEQYLEEWARRLRQPPEAADHDVVSVVVMRLQREYLALETGRLAEVTPLLPIHAVPHRLSPVLLGLVNIRGRLRMCISLHQLLGLESDATAGDMTTGDMTAAYGTSPESNGNARLVILQDRAEQWVFPVEEVVAVQSVADAALRSVPATCGPTSSYTRAVFTWQQHTVGLLDIPRVLEALRSACS